MSDIETTSATWRAVLEWAEATLAERRDELETPGLPPERTENLRGAIAELTDLIALPNRKPEPPADALKTDDLPGFSH